MGRLRRLSHRLPPESEDRAKIPEECDGGCCGLTGSLYDGGASSGTFRISCDWRAGGHSGGQAATSHATGERAFESLGGGGKPANSPESPSVMSCLGVSFRFEFYQTFRGTHNQKPVQRISHILRSTPRQSQGGGELPF